MRSTSRKSTCRLAGIRSDPDLEPQFFETKTPLNYQHNDKAPRPNDYKYGESSAGRGEAGGSCGPPGLLHMLVLVST